MANKYHTNYMPKKIITGGQTGVDRGALDACLARAFSCGGWCPKGRLAEDGKIDNKYPLLETPDSDYDTRTKYNVESSDGTLIISPGNLLGGTLLTRQIVTELHKPVLMISPELSAIKSFTIEILKWLVANNIYILNVAGPRKSEWEPGYQISFQIINNLIGESEKLDLGLK